MIINELINKSQLKYQVVMYMYMYLFFPKMENNNFEKSEKKRSEKNQGKIITQHPFHRWANSIRVHLSVYTHQN